MSDQSPKFELPPSLATLSTLGRPRHFGRGDLIVKEGDLGHCLYITLAGRIRIYVDGADGRRFVIGSYGPGGLFGEGSLDGGPRTATVEAMTPIECVEIPYAELLAKLSSDARFAMALTMELIGRSRSSTRRLKGLALGSVYERFRELVQQESGDSKAIPHVIAIGSQQEIADRLGSSRDMVTRILRELARGDYIAHRRGELTLLKPLPRQW